MKFIYKAKKGPKEIVEGVIEAAHQDDAVAKIRNLGLVPINAEKGPDDLTEKVIVRKQSAPKLFAGKKVTKKHIYIFTRKLKVLLKSHEPLLNSLYFLEEQITNNEFRKIIRTITGSVREGLSFSESLEKFPQHFSQFYVNIIKAGEASGKLDNSLEEIARYLESERLLSQKVISSLAYPAVMVSVGFATIIFIITFVVPKLKPLFEDFTDKIPFITKVLLNTSVFLSKYWVVFFAFIAALVVFFIFSKGAPWQKKMIAVLKQKTPIVKVILYNQSLCRFSGGLSILLSSGVALLDSLRISIPLIDNEIAQKELEGACQQILAGGSLEESLRSNCGFLPDMFTKMVAVGETSGRLDEILMELAESYADEVETMTKIVTSLIEPMAILVVGGILSFIVVAVLLPIFEMSLFIQ